MNTNRLSRRLFCLTALGALAACGFTPVYGPGGGGAALQNAVLVDDPITREAYLLTREVEERLGRATDPQYGLSLDITVREESIAISSDNVTTRYNLIGQVTYALRDLNTQQVVNSGKVNSFTGYSASGTTVATQAAERDARARLMQILADQMITRLVAAAPTP
ncbi:LPS assembly lipoprotein LptE [Rhodobacteraceae bacterium KMM 6894]|nr:LPS assembly lipoprotein LptE [Rhodobacteraceae bacterium KMM 6894]